MKLCLDCTEYSCGAQGSYNISETCGDSETYFHSPKEYKIKTESDEEAEYETELMNRAYDTFITMHPESEETTGYWIKFKVNTQHKIKCSKCDYTESEYASHIRNYCPNCGIKMIGYKEEK